MLQKKIEYKGLQFPTTIESPHAVAQVLNQEKGKLKVKDLRDSKSFVNVVFVLTQNVLHFK